MSTNNQRGTYALLMQLKQPVDIEVGRLGTFAFPPGYYLYLGSARGPGGLAARLKRHRRRHKKLRWHVDYLLPHAELLEVWSAVSGERLECRWAEAARALPGAEVVVPRFGASDCRCPAHLYRFAQRPDFARFKAAVEGERPGLHVTRAEVGIEAALRALETGDEAARQAATQALVERGQAAIAPLATLLETAGDGETRCWAAWVLGHIGGEAAVDALSRGLADADSAVRSSVALALGDTGAAQAVVPLLQLLDDESALVRQCAAGALEKIGERAVDVLIDALQHGSLPVRVGAARVLARLAPEEAVIPLYQARHDESPVVCYYAQEALDKIAAEHELVLLW